MRMTTTNRRLGACLAVMLAVVLMALPGLARAAEGETSEQVGSITLVFGEASGGSQAGLVGGTIVAYRVAGVDHTEDALYDIAKGQFAKSQTAKTIPAMSKAELDRKNAALAEKLLKEAQGAGLKPYASAAISGQRAKFASLPEGLYLLYQSELSEGGRKMNTFLMSVPNDEGELDVVAAPKPGVYVPKDKDTTNSGTVTPNTDSAKATAARITQRVPQTGDASLSALPWAVGGLCVVLIGALVCRHAGAAGSRAEDKA